MQLNIFLLLQRYCSAVIAAIEPRIIPGILHTSIGQSFFGFKAPYSAQVKQFSVVMRGSIIEPGWPLRFLKI